MSVSLSRETNTITVANFWESHILKKYNFNPVYQRQSVWSDEKQSFFIDSVLKNFPVPPIFLHQKIDDETGKTTYDVIDGKQRLTSLIRFLKNEIPASDEFENSPFYDEKIAGVFFKDLDRKELSEYKKKLWRYVIPIEYIDTSDKEVIDNIFDRLNRNGEPLKDQELRRSKYHDSELLELVETLAEEPFWKERLKVTDVARMEHYEFISEIIFQLIEEESLHAGQKILDDLYEKYARSDRDWDDLRERFLAITQFMEQLDIPYKTYQVSGVSHLYGLWCLSHYCTDKGITSDDVKDKVVELYKALRSQAYHPLIEKYRKSMSSRTKDKGQRKRRLEALTGYVGI